MTENASLPSVPRGEAGRALTRVFTVWFRGEPSPTTLRALQEHLGLADEGSRLDDEEDVEFGRRRLSGDTYRAVLTLHREDHARWSVALSNEGQRPPEQIIEQCRTDVFAAAQEAGWTFERESSGPVSPPRPQAPPEALVRRSPSVHDSHAVWLCGEVTRESLRRLRNRLGLNSRGRLEDDWDSEFGYRYVRDEPPNRVRLSLSRKSNTEWLASLTYQGEPPTPEMVQQTRADIFDAAQNAGLTVVQG